MIQNFFKGVLLSALIALAIFLGMWVVSRPLPSLPETKVTKSRVQQKVIMELRSESQASFLVSGEMELLADIMAENTKYLFPEYFDDKISLGTTSSNVRLPGRVTYGIDLRHLKPEFIDFNSDSIVTISTEEIKIHSVEAYLDKMEVETKVGWARLYSRSGQRIERKAVIEAKNALRYQAELHLQNSTQPILNTERTLSEVLTPVLKSLGIPNPVVKCRIAPYFFEAQF